MPSFDFLSLALATTALVSLTRPAVCRDPKSPPPAPSTPHKGCELFGQTEHNPRELLVGRDYEAAHAATSGYRAANEAGPTAAVCVNGRAAGYPCSKVDLLSVTTNQQLCGAQGTCGIINDVWGWTHEGSGREFALVAMQAGTAFIEVTDPYHPVVVGKLPTVAGLNAQGTFWRDIKTIGHHALVVSEEQEHGLQIFDLTLLLNKAAGTVFGSWRHGGFANAHNVFVHEDSGFAYVVGSSECGGGMYVLDMANPIAPYFAGCYTQDGYVHDVQCVIYSGPDTSRAGREICFASVEDALTIVDVTDKANPVRLSRLTYSNSDRTYTHQGWLTEDQRYFLFGDELDERKNKHATRTHVADVSNLAAPRYVGYHAGRTDAVDHNLYVLGDRIYQANYAAGFNLLRVVDPAAARFEEAGFFDLLPESDGPQFNGAWSVYPYLPSGNVLVSGIEEGLFVLRLHTANNVTPPPTNLPTSPPTNLPTSPPTNLPTSPPTNPPTSPPIAPPTLPVAHPPPSTNPSTQPTLTLTPTCSAPTTGKAFKSGKTCKTKNTAKVPKAKGSKINGRSKNNPFDPDNPFPRRPGN